MAYFGHRACFAFCVVVWLTSCSIEDEIGYPGGNVGRLADENLVPAYSQLQRADRMLVSLALTVPITADLVSTRSEARQSVGLIRAAYEAINDMYEGAALCLLGQRYDNGEFKSVTDECKRTGVGSGNAFTFETDAATAQRAVAGITLYAVNHVNREGLFDKVMGLIDDIISLDVGSLLQKANGLLGTAHRHGATYRDISVIFASSVEDACPSDNPPDKCGVIRLLLKEAQNGVKSTTDQRDPNGRVISQMMDNAKDLARNGTFRWKLEAAHKAALINQINRGCEKLELLSIDSLDSQGNPSLNKEERCTVVNTFPARSSKNINTDLVEHILSIELPDPPPTSERDNPADGTDESAAGEKEEAKK